jgi:bifunctional DNA-binding transcriptional regulator/antitoxin component of YhaV-PrlF toxin-antitoxin module
MTSTTERSKLIRPLRGGQITIPIAFRKSLGIDENTMLRVTLCEDELRITPVRVDEPSKGSQWLRELYEYFAPVREEIRARGISQEELYADIDAAIEEVRAEERARLTKNTPD